MHGWVRLGVAAVCTRLQTRRVQTRVRTTLTLTLTCRYLENVPSIVPLLEKEYRNAARRLEDTQEELTDLHPDKCARLRLFHALGSAGTPRVAATWPVRAEQLEAR